MWSPNSQGLINKIEQVQKSLVSRIADQRIHNLSYWDKLKTLHLYSQERRRERYFIIFVWKISQGLVDGYNLSFTERDSRTGRKAVIASISNAAPAAVKRARAASLAVMGAQLFNCMPAQLRNSDHGDVLMFKNHLDIYLQTIPDEPTVPGQGRAASTNSLIHQVPLVDLNQIPGPARV